MWIKIQRNNKYSERINSQINHNLIMHKVLDLLPTRFHSESTRWFILFTDPKIIMFVPFCWYYLDGLEQDW